MRKSLHAAAAASLAMKTERQTTATTTTQTPSHSQMGFATAEATTTASVSATGDGGGSCHHGQRSTLRFHRQDDTWFCDAKLPTDIIIQVDDISFHLHKFPLMSKCGKIAHMLEEESQDKKVGFFHASLIDCPGGPDAFLFAAHFCYGIRVDLTPSNILTVHCIAEYLHMTEDYGEENLLEKSKDFFQKFVIRSWKDCIVALQSFRIAIPMDKTIRIVNKSLNALSVMVCTDPSLFGWPMMMYGSLQSPGGSILWNGINTGARIRSSISDWWFEDVSCLSMPLFKRLVEMMKEKGIRSKNIAGIITYYARKYLPGLDRWHGVTSRETSRTTIFKMTSSLAEQKSLLENIEKLLPHKKGMSCCRFLLGLLRFSIILNASQSCKNSLERRIGMQLELASLDGLLVPSFSDSDNLYDTDCVERIIHHFASSGVTSATLFSPTSFDPAASLISSPSIKVTKLIDSYLAEVAPDVNLKPEKMCSLAEALPDSFRSLDDGLYRALDIYFKAHPWLSEKERERLCNIIDYGKLSMDACAHASQNVHLPLRVVLQVLFFEQLQLKKVVSGCCLHGLDRESGSEAIAMPNSMTGDGVGRWSDGWVSMVRENQVMKVDMEKMRMKVAELEQEFVGMKQKITKGARQSQRGRCSADSPQHVSISRKFGCIPQFNRIEKEMYSPRKSITLQRQQ